MYECEPIIETNDSEQEGYGEEDDQEGEEEEEGAQEEEEEEEVQAAQVTSEKS